MSNEYNIWSEENMKTLEKHYSCLSGDAKEIGNGVFNIIETANKEHNKAMLKKDVEIAKLQGLIEGLGFINKIPKEK